MIAAGAFRDVLKARGYRCVTGVPCSYFAAPLRAIAADPDMRYVAAANEGGALSIAAGAMLAGQRAAVLIQNSGLGNLVNPLTSLLQIYGIPVLLFVSGRAYPPGTPDEPQHRLMGPATRPLLADVGVRDAELPDDAGAFVEALDALESWMATQRRVAAFVVPKGAFGDVAAGAAAGEGPALSRREAVAGLARWLKPADAVVASTGYISREVFAGAERPGNFYMQGSMGHALAIGLGVALSRPHTRVVVVDGDGALVMHMGTLSTVGHCRPRNLLHVVIDNEGYESTGGQPTTSPTTDFGAVALACGYAWSRRCDGARALDRALEDAAALDGPGLVHVKVGRMAGAAPPRVTDRYSPEQNADRFHDFLASA